MMNDLIKKDCKALEEVLRCCKKEVIATFDKTTNNYDVRCQCCNKSMKSPFLTKIIFNWMK